MTGPCTVCRRPRLQFPMAFRGDAQCSVLCKKAAEHEPPTPPLVAEEECST